MATNVRYILNTYHFNILKDMVRLLGIMPKDKSKQAHIDALTPHLFTKHGVQTGLKQLSKREKKALDMIQRADAEISSGRLKQQLLRHRVVQIKKDEHNYYYRFRTNIHAAEQQRVNFEQVVGRLIAAGLICAKDIASTRHSARSKIYYDNFSSVYIPPKVKRLLPDPKPLVVHTLKPQDLDRIDPGSARAFQRDLYLYWSATRAEPLNLTNDLRLYKKDLKRVNAALQHPQDLGHQTEQNIPRLIFIRRLITSIGLLKQQGKSVSALERPKFLSQNPTTRVQRTFKAWRDGSFWNEVLSIPNISTHNIGTRLDDVPKQIAQARKTVLNNIVALHKDSWIAIDTLIDRIRLHKYDFLLPRDFKPQYTYYYYSYTGRTPYSAYGNAMRWDFGLNTSDEAEGWECVEANFVRTMLVEPLLWMGLVDIGYIDERPEAYRLTPMGAWVLGVGGKIDIPAGEGKVVVQPNYEIFALDPISDMALARLDEFADRISAERAMQYTLCRESVYRAQKRGWTAARIIDTLQKMSDHPLPQNITRTLQEWQTLHERITIHRQATLLHAVDAKLMDELTETLAVNSHITSRPGKTVAIVAPEQKAADMLLKALQELGQLPTRTRTAQDVLRPSLTIDQNGQLRFREALPSIYLFAQITPFTERDEQNHYLLTEAAVKHALEDSFTVDKILDLLRTLHIGPLPRWVEIKIRAWGNYYGNAAIQPLLLVQIRDEQTLKELMSEPELKGMLKPFKPTRKKALACVAPEHLASLREALAERGIEIAGTLT